MSEEQRLARISELEALCAGQAFDHGKSIAEIMAEHIVVKEQKVAALTREVEGLRTALKPYAEMEQSVLWDDHGDAVEVWNAPEPQVARNALSATTDTTKEK